MQKTNFRFEAIVHDDASTDGTAAIIREYAEKYPDIIKPIYETENQWSKGTLGKIMSVHTHGKYVALCEGDDYWTDPLKLQRQVDYLENHIGCSAIGENGIELLIETGRQQLFNSEPARFFSIDEMIERRRFPTASVVYRKDALDEKWESIKHQFDTMLWCFLASKGKFYYNAIISSVYRRGPGVTVAMDPYQFAKMVEDWSWELQANFPASLSTNRMKRKVISSYINAANRYIKRKAFSKKLFLCYKRGITLSPWLFIYQLTILYYVIIVKRLLLPKTTNIEN